MKKMFTFLMTATLLVGLTAGCGMKDSNNGSASTTKPTDNTEANSDMKNTTDNGTDNTKKFTLKIIASGNTDDGLDIATEMYKKKYPNADVQVITSTWGNGGQDMRNKELLMLSSGETPDIGKMVWGKEFFRAGVLEDITDQVKSWEIYNHLSDGQKDRMSLDGKIFGVTFGNNSVYMFYNKDILTKVGVTEAPKTLDELTAIAKKIKEAGLKTADGKPIYATSFEGGNWATDYWLWANGGQQMSDDFSKTLIDSPESIKAFQYMQDFVKNGYAPKIDNSYDQLWLNGQIAFWPCGDWDIPATNNAKINAGYAPMPKGSSGLSTTSIGGVEWGVFKQSKQKKEAEDFIQILVSKEFQVKFNRGVTDLTLYDEPQVQDNWKKDGTFEGRLAEKEQLKNTKYNFLEAPFIFPDASKIYNSALEKILVRGDDVEKTMKDAAEEINKGIETELNQ